MNDEIDEQLSHYSSKYWVDAECVYLGKHEGLYYCFQGSFYYTPKKPFLWEEVQLEDVPQVVYTAYCMAKLEGREL